MEATIARYPRQIAAPVHDLHRGMTVLAERNIYRLHDVGSATAIMA
jgi:hypothetical protein